MACRKADRERATTAWVPLLAGGRTTSDQSAFTLTGATLYRPSRGTRQVGTRRAAGWGGACGANPHPRRFAARPLPRRAGEVYWRLRSTMFAYQAPSEAADCSHAR